MFANDCDHFEVINDSLNGTRQVDEETFSSVAVLAERLDKLKRNTDLFEDITFSPQLEELVSCEMISAIS
jgi:hypothetical protein